MKKILFLLCLFTSGISVVKADDTYVKVTSTDQLVVGAEYILVAQTEFKICIADALVSNSYLSTGAGGTGIGENLITLTSGNPLVFTLGGDANGYTLRYKNAEAKDRYLKRSSLIASNLVEGDSDNDDMSKWLYDPITFKLSNKKLSNSGIQYLLSFDSNQIKAYNSSLNYPLACLYMRLSDVASITLSEVCTDGTRYYGTYSSGNAFVVPDDLTVSEIKVDGDGKLTICNYAVGDIVPANTGVMVSSAAAGEHSVVLSDEEGNSILGNENCLYPSGDNGISLEEMGKAHPNCMYYRLTMHNGKTLGYYWGANGGGTFDLAHNKAYLAIPAMQARSISGFDLVDNEMTGIHTLPIMHADEATYNLYGQRVGDSAKGILIKNGKKQIKR